MKRSLGKASRPLILALKSELEEAADPKRAPMMQAYMKSTMPYYGVNSPGVGAITQRVFKDHPLASFEAWRDTALSLWRTAKFREERYAAIALLGVRSYKTFRTLDALPIYEEMIVDGAWWDFVDQLATHRLGELMRAWPAKMKPIMRRWSKDDDMWRRRSSIICQLKLKEATDLGLLYACIAPSLDSKEFFLRKAIGWALREIAWRDPDEVIRYVELHDKELSGLSKREALKNIRHRLQGM